MARLLSNDLQAVWLLQSRVSIARLQFWLILAGYDLKTKSFESRTYLLYLILFFGIWIFATLTLLADAGRSLLELLPFGGPLRSAVGLGLLGLIGFFLFQLNLSTRRSPFIFSESDAHLLCMTPLDRRPVALAWFLKDWLMTGIFVWAAAVVLGYALLEAQTLGELGAADLPRYFLAGLRMLVIALPLQLGLHSLAWSIGAMRLNPNRQYPWLRWLTLLASLGLTGTWLLNGVLGGDALPDWLGVLSFPIQAGLGGGGFLPGLGLAWLWMGFGLGSLWQFANEVSLSKAAQETQGIDVMRSAAISGATDVVQEMKQRQRLGSGQRPSRLLSGQGWLALVSRNLIQALRGLSASSLAGWAMILAVGLGIFLVPDWEGRVFMTLTWILLLGNHASRPVRKDLSRWWLMNQLPDTLERLLLVNLILPVSGLMCLGLLGLGGVEMMGISLPPYVWVILIPMTIGVSLGTIIDVVKQCRTSQLLAGLAPDMTFLSVVIGVLVVSGCYAAGWFLVDRWALPVWVWVPLVSAIAIGLDCGLLAILRGLLQKLRAPMRRESNHVEV